MPDSKFLKPLNGLRGIAAMIVVIAHYSNETELWGRLIGAGGQNGVMLFFILSGFLMGYLYFEQSFTLSNVGNYLLRRFARVYPLFIFAAALPSFLIWIGFPSGVAYAAINSLTIFFHQVLLIDRGLGAFWTIRVEIFFYFVFVGIWVIHFHLRNILMTGLIVISALVFLRLKNYDFGIEFFDKIHYFLFGVLLISQ